MTTRSSAMACMLPAVMLCGCNIHPLPEDISRHDTTYQIVAKVRCEARDAIREIAKELLGKYGSDDEKDLPRQLDAGTLTYEEAFQRKYSPKIRLYFDRYAKSFIGYDFQLNMTEADSQGFSVGAFNPFSNETRRLGIGNSIDLSRQNNRSFRITDEFAKLATDVKDDYCAVKAKSRNIANPIVGRIGLKESLETFLWLNERGNLRAPSGTDVITMSDTLEFSTTLKGNIDPSLELAPVSSGVSISTLALMSSSSRVDKHKLIFAMSMPTMEDQKPMAQASVPRVPRTPASRPSQAPALPRMMPSAAPPAASPAEDRAIQELDRQENLRLNRGLERFLDSY